MKRCALLGLLALTAMQAAFAADEQDHRKWWGLDIGVYRPNNEFIRDKFGGALLRVGFRPLKDRISEKWRFIYDVNVLAAEKDDDRLLAVPITFGFTRSFGDKDARTVPFVQFGVGPAYYDYIIHRGTDRISTKRVGGNANIELGVLMDKRFAVVARGDFYTKTDDLDFSGVSLTFSYAAFRW